MAPRRDTDLKLHRAFDTVRFGDANILNLRESLPTVVDATHRADAWLRQRQVEGATEVLVVTGRGRGSDNGISPVREAILRLIASLRRAGVLERYEEHTAGSFSIQLAPVHAMINAPFRQRDRARKPATVNPDLSSLGKGARAMLRELAERSLDALGVKQTTPFIEAEMLRQLGAIRAALPHDSDRDAGIRAAIKHALDQAP